MKLKPELIFRSVIALVLLAGILWTAINLLQAGDFNERLQAKLDTIKQLREIKRQQDGLEQSFATLATISSNKAPSLTALAASSVTGSVAEIHDLDSRPLGGGWNAKRTEVTFNEVNLNLLAGFLRAAETQRPPWRLVECAITSSKRADGIGNVKLTLETVAQQPMATK